jgi:hypothetical protein
MAMAAKFYKHLTLLQEYQYMNQLKPLAKLNPLGKVEQDLQAQLVDVCLDVMVVAVVMEDLELCCTTGLAFHFHQALFW